MTKYHRYELINTEELQKDLEVRKLMIEKQLIKLKKRIDAALWWYVDVVIFDDLIYAVGTNYNNIDIYDMTQAVEDGATRPVYYESRVIKLHLDPEVLKRIDEEYVIINENFEEEEFSIEKITSKLKFR